MFKKKELIYYPVNGDKEAYEKISKKKEFYLNRRKKIEDTDIDKLCKREEFSLMPQQKFLKNFMSPDSPYKNLLVVHGTGAGKCVAGSTLLNITDRDITIKELWDKYHTEIILDNEHGEWSKCRELFKIKSYDTRINKVVYLPINFLYRQKIKEYIYDITLEDETNIKITKAHKLYVNDNEFSNKFILNNTKIGILENNTIIFKAIKDFKFLYYDDYVYDVEIETLHNYFGNNILCHNTCAAIQIAESFKNYLIRLEDRTPKEITKKVIKPTIYIIAGDAAINNFKSELLGKCVGEEYISLSEKKKLKSLSEDTNVELYKKKLKEYNKRLTSRSQNGFYKFLGYRDFQNRTIGEKIKDASGHVIKDPETGKSKRKIKEPHINNVNNSLIIVDEAHNLVNSNQPNDWAKAIHYVYKRSKNVRLILLTATPMTHRPREIIDILNLIRLDKKEEPLKKIDFFKDEKLLPGADKIIAEKCRGYISYLRGYNIYTYPKKIDMGILLNKKGFKYTKLVTCPMSKLHYKTYKSVYHGKVGREEWSLVNMVFPNPSDPNIGIYKNSEIDNLINAPKDFKKKHGINFITIGDTQQITGDFLKKENLKKYSTKYYQLLDNLDNAILKDNGHSFIYSKIVIGTGTRLIKQILLQNGYDEYSTSSTNSSYDTIKCYYCGKLGKNHGNDHVYYPARFIIIDRDKEKREQKSLIENFVSDENKDGRIAKIIIGSPLTKEAIDLKRIMYLHITSFHDNYSLLAQIIGRGARHCSHADLEKNKRFVKIFRYVSSLPDLNDKTLSYEESRYLDGEKHNITIKQIERILKINAIDCTLNKEANMFPEEVIKYRNCETKKNPKKCSPLCDYTNCDYQCFYELPQTFKLDTSTYDIYHYANELEIITKYIINMFKQYPVWTIDDIIYMIYKNSKTSIDIDKFKNAEIQNIEKKNRSVKTMVPKAKSYIQTIKEDMEYIDIKYIYLALQNLVDNKTVIHNTYDNEGKLINVGSYYIFQPLDNNNEDIPLFERNLPIYNINKTNISMNSYITKYYKPKIKVTKEMTINEIKNKITETDDSVYICKLLGSLPLATQILILENAIELSYQSLNEKDKEYTKRIFRFYRSYLIDNKKFKGTYDYRFSRKIVSDLYNDNNVQIIGHILTKEPKCYINKKWISCIYELYSTSRKKTVRSYIDNDYIIGYIDKTKHGKMVFKLRYTNPENIKSKDKRRIYKGFICSQHNNKKEILAIAKNLGIDNLTIKSTIQKICCSIEEKLRKNEIAERAKPNSKIKWFYEYIEIMNN